MIEYRPFRNGDLPGLADVWRTQPRNRGMMQPMSTEIFEQHVLSKPYFDAAGLCIAVEGTAICGFSHAGFGPTPDEQGISTERGTTCLVMVRTSDQRRGIGAELLRRSEAYLVQRGAREIYGGAGDNLTAFYRGLYGGSDLAGILESHASANQLFQAQGYQAARRSIVWRRELAGFRAPVDRAQIQLRRRVQFTATFDPPARSWWQACTWSGLETTRFDVRPREGGAPLATALFWDILPLATSWGVHAAGLVELEVAPDQRRQGLATYLLAEAFRYFVTQSVTLVEATVPIDNEPLQRLLTKLGFREIDRGTLYRKG